MGNTQNAAGIFTNRYGLIVDYLAEFYREMRKRSFADAIDKHFKFGSDLNQRDVIAGRKMVSGQLKLLYPHGEFDKEAVRQRLEHALEARRRIKENWRHGILRCALLATSIMTAWKSIS